MGRTRTRGIILEEDGTRTVNKVWRGERIFYRLGAVSQDEAENWLASEIARLKHDRERNSGHYCRLFADGAAQYLKEVAGKATAELIAWHIRLLLPYIGTTPLNHIHDGTLESFKEDRLAGLIGLNDDEKPKPVTPTTVNRSLEVVRTILNRAARVWRDDGGEPWLDSAPPLITMLDENERPPYPINWDEQDALFPKLAPHLQEMALFDVNTGLRDENICGLKWSWEQDVPEVGRSVFIIPASEFKTKVPHVVILNDAAWSIIEKKRRFRELARERGDEISEYVFTYTGKGKTDRIGTMNNNGWQNARKRAELTMVRVHDLRHTYATRLRLAGVAKEDRAALLGHEGRSMPEHYAAADIGRLIELSNLVLNRAGTRTLLRVVNG